MIPASILAALELVEIIAVGNFKTFKEHSGNNVFAYQMLMRHYNFGGSLEKGHNL